MNDYSKPACAPRLMVRDHEGQYLLATPEQVLGAARGLIDQMTPNGTQFSSPSDTQDYFRTMLAGKARETFAVMFLDCEHRLIEYVEMFHGTLTQTSVYPREVVKKALSLNAAAIVCSHNHPSGNASPSRADELLTHTLKAALALVDVSTLDHIIVAGADTYSFAAHGLI